ncbi:hypothetical protein RJ639_038781 [Escallonia herrerae]|uniref:PPM-type phosphatase domain-containing protein n=1 Tax=Escallonia herrerae TaxID=1293975 RepID=A0AA88WLC2_9ASTE|nr:hypothetical protein RJ639_038781 [Escallonia herrerae]
MASLCFGGGGPATPLSVEERRKDVVEVEGDGYSIYCKKGRREFMEDRFSAAVNVHGDPKHAFFGVFEGHGGAKATEFVAQNLEKEILSEVESEASKKGFANLTKLVYLDPRQNSFNGTILLELFHLSFLRYVDLSSNSLEGVLSPEVSYLQILRTLRLDENFIGGDIPREIENLTKLQNLSLCHNEFLSGFPSSILQLKELEELYLKKNLFSMLIPSEIGKLSNISTLAMGKNKLTGVSQLQYRT